MLKYTRNTNNSGIRFYNASVNSKRQHPPPPPPGQIFEVGKTFLQNHNPLVKKTPTPGEDFETDLVSFFCWSAL